MCPSATWRLIIGLTLMFTLAPATRFGYYIYPAGLLAWLLDGPGRPARIRPEAVPAPAATDSSYPVAPGRS